MVRKSPGSIRDAIISFMREAKRPVHINELYAAMGDVAPSSIRSYLRLNTPSKFERVGRGKYRLK